ncbi:hypothetical protein [Brachyspira pilosicoli]|uniref:hypothetical protein n=1 Tax=Brachyspira pilosicoli TaxID=52584 RepID=UPI003003FF07
MITGISSTSNTNKYVQSIGGVEVTVTTDLTEKTTTINVAAKLTGGALNAQA